VKNRAFLIAPIAFALSTVNGLPAKPAVADPPSTPDPVSGVRQPASPDFDSLVKALKGRWATLVYQGEADDRNSQASPDHGEQVWRTGPGGLTLIEEEHVASRSGDQYVLALHWWDRSTNSLKGMLCNNSGPGACNVDSFYRSKLNWDGKRLTIDLVFPQGSKMMLWHEEFGDFTGNSFTQTGDIGDVGGPLKRVVTIRAKKVGEISN